VSPERKRCVVILLHSLLQAKASEARTVCAGKELAVWRDAEGEWRCFEDKCPHRRGTSFIVQLYTYWDLLKGKWPWRPASGRRCLPASY
jgi:hypothetical protein